MGMGCVDGNGARLVLGLAEADDAVSLLDWPSSVSILLPLPSAVSCSDLTVLRLRDLDLGFCCGSSFGDGKVTSGKGCAGPETQLVWVW